MSPAPTTPAPPPPAQAKSNPPPPVKKINKIIPVFFIFVVMVIGGSIGFSLYRKFSQKKQPSSEETKAKKTSAGPLYSLASLKADLPQFAQWKEETISITPSIPAYTIDPQQIENLKPVENSLKQTFNSDQLQALANPGFFLIKAKNKLSDPNQTIDFTHFGMIDEFLMHYQDIMGASLVFDRQPENTVFITSDLLLHSFHVFLDRTFQYIEESEFHPKLLSLTSLLLDKCLEEYQKATDPKIKASLERLITFYAVPRVILETSQPMPDKYFLNPGDEEKVLQNDKEIDTPEKISAALEILKSQLPVEAYEKAKAEIDLINEGKGADFSPLFGSYTEGDLHDYSQYKPRSHYYKNSVLRSYWKAMIWYGRNGFLVKSDELTLDALIQTLFLNSLTQDNIKALQLWENIYLPTVFFVGKSDDLAPYDYQKLINEVYGTNPSLNSLADEQSFSQFKEKVKELAGPAIQSSIIMVETGEQTEQELLQQTKSWRFMGQRFIPDSFIFSELTQGDTAPDPETGQKLPAVPTSLMPMSIFGSERAEVYLQDWIKNQAPDSDKVIANKKAALDEAFAELELADWTQNLYWSWLYTLKSLFQKFGEGYPKFMQTEAWNDKDLNASLGSWTELRHDTLLYAKQSYAELGMGMPDEEPPPVPKGYVEPNLQFLNRIIALAQMAQDGLETNNVLPEEQKWKIEKMIGLFKFYRELAVRELQNQKISDEEFEKLRTSPPQLNECLKPPTGSFITASEARAGLIADVHTAMTMECKEILYEATGIPYIIFVAVKDTNGTRLTRGMVYSYYEFSRPFGERLADQDWQGVVYEAKTDFPLPEAAHWLLELEK